METHPSTNTTSGSLIVTGGAGISENLHVGGNTEMVMEDLQVVSGVDGTFTVM